MFDFETKGGDRVALRPELTASIMRAFVEHRPPTPWKVWHAGPELPVRAPPEGPLPPVRPGRRRDRRHRRPRGRRRGDRPRVALLRGARAAPGHARRSTAWATPATGPATSRPFAGSSRPTSPTCPSRAARPSGATPCGCSTPSAPRTRAVVAAAPVMTDFLSADSAAAFERVQAGLGALGVPFELAPRLVRGLDYYTRTAFEYVGTGLGTTQDAVGGGGRYDGLVEALGGPPTPGIGLALGVDRTLLACDAEGAFPVAGDGGRRLRGRRGRRHARDGARRRAAARRPRAPTAPTAGAA